MNRQPHTLIIGASVAGLASAGVLVEVEVVLAQKTAAKAQAAAKKPSK